ncbi:MAG: PD-(D/E)XK motif protein, partial [Tannerellaceae bacterium]
KLQGECVTIFNEKLEQLGLYSDYEITDYNSTSYSINFETMYTIIEGFPCITKRNLDNALLNVSYDIDQRLCTDYEVMVNEVIKKIIKI